MNKETKTTVITHFVAVVLMALITLVYFKPLLEGKEVRQSDMMFFEGMSKELKDYHDSTGEYSYWTNAMFSGMPAAYIYAKPDANVYWWMGLPIQKGTPMMSYGIVLMLLICFYIAMNQMGLSPLISFGAAIAYAFCSYNLIIVEAGHVTKGYTIAAIPLVVSGVILAYQNKYLSGFLLFMIGFGFSLSQSHPQITYYTGFAVGIYAIITFIYAIFKKQLKNFFKSSAILLVAGILAILPNIGGLFTSYDYSKESMRGQSELTAKANSNGLDYQYAYAWSYGVSETFTLLIPNVKGGPSHFDSWEEYEKNMPTTINTLRTTPMGQDPNQILQNCSTYWGDQPFTSGPVYAGAIVCLLFVFSMFLIKGEMRIWAIVVFIVSIVLSWGKNFPIINDWMFYHFPMFNKFRTPSMILVLTTFIMAFFGFYGLKSLIDKSYTKQQLNKYLYISFGIIGGLCFLIAIVPSMFFSFYIATDANLPEAIQSAIITDRAALCSQDAWRSFIFIALVAICLWLFINEKIKAKYMVGAVAILTLIDLWFVDKRYLNDNSFADQQKTVSQQYSLTPCDASIKMDKSLGYRVLNLAVNPFTDAHASYFHHSIGGYHGAKLRRYQEFVDSVMNIDLNHFYSNINNIQNEIDQANLLASLKSLNMLNTKYIIYNYQAAPLVNNQRYGSAWFVDNIQFVPNANQEIIALRKSNPLQTAVVNEEFKDKLNGFTPSHNPNSTIELIEQTSKTCTYKVNALKDELAVFSEIYYPKYWKVTIDGKEVDNLLRANYILRAMMVPKGEHTITMEFVPQAWFNARTISLISSIFIILLIGGLIGYKYYYLPRKKIKNKK